MKDLQAYANQKIDEACDGDADTATIRYWVGYLDGVRAAAQQLKGGAEDGR